MLLRLLFIVAAVVIAACAARTRPDTTGALSLADELARELRAEGGVPWASGRPLRWTDFVGVVPPGRTESALTAYSLFYGVRCRNTSSRIQFLVTAAFLPSRSWVKPAVLTNPERSRRTLAHEQTHFNLSEFHARRMRKYFAELFNACGEQDELLRSSAQRFVADEATAQARYDEETRHGLLEDRQVIWDRYATERLAELDAFGNERVSMSAPAAR